MLERITGTWLLAQARKRKSDDEKITWEIAIDGKVMRGAWTDENDQVTLFSAMLQEENLTIAQVRVPDGTNETTQVKALASEIGVQEGEYVLVTLDAAHCNKETADFIGGKPGWGYLITVKTDKADMNGHTRKHWRIENKSYYICDTVFRETIIRASRETARKYSHNFTISP